MFSRTATRIPEDRLAEALGDKAGESNDATGSEGISTGLLKLPKADVHCHALLNCPLSTYEKVLGYKLPLPPPRFRDFGEFGSTSPNHPLYPATAFGLLA